MKANYHTHTYRCHHAKMVSDEEYVIKAIEAGFDELTFTDHVPFEYLDDQPEYNDRMAYSELDEYLKSINSLKEAYKDRISIHVGFESEYFPSRLDYYKELKKKSDILILGQHYSSCLSGDYWFCSDDRSMDLYADYVTEGLESGLFSIFAHPDLFILSHHTFDDKCREITHRLGKALEKTQVPAEINLGGFNKQKREVDGEMVYPYPYRKVWEILSQYNIKVIIGYDAHDPNVLTDGSLKQKALDIVQGLNLNIIESIDI